MNITILTYGSRGDVQPFLALAVGLQKAGHTVKLAAPHRFADFVDEYKIPFVPLAGDPEVISQRLNDAGANPLRMVRAMGDYIFSIADQVARQAFAACEDADLIIHSFLFTTGGHSVARKLRHPRYFCTNLSDLCTYARLSTCVHAGLASRYPQLLRALAAYPNFLAGREGRIQATAQSASRYF